MKPDKELARLDEDIAAWQRIVDEYPNSLAYKKILEMAIQHRTAYVDNIGRK